MKEHSIFESIKNVKKIALTQKDELNEAELQIQELRKNWHDQEIKILEHIDPDTIWEYVEKNFPDELAEYGRGDY
jgi:uncharacterized protein YydD (DUF2326 family)